ncbi:thiolase family protein [Bosea sp. (in: a-proteobacteria)]|uniref:thiolase family protein n=1 Tax=Bosea sp. (in: a-proteobacteria) TaxID=1871050 RepID=UPI00263075B4|nr:thiolase family protein [Bosea sp. (in: a-proteobacteria)]MCO5089572.1 thiolase family protein [Bosea sp. (in: a-proteobacteria)]MCO5089583.1 thiolase family protein [Bosea sp. (in: a-proteobacteria)]
MGTMRDRAAIIGVGNNQYGKMTAAVSPLVPLAAAFKNALADAGIQRDEVDGILVNIGTPFGVDYDQVSEAFGLDIRFSDQTWTHGRQMSGVLAHAAMAVDAGLANYVACVCSINWARAGTVGDHGQFQDDREIGGAHFEHPYYGMTSPGGAWAMAARKYFDRYGATSADLAEVCVSIREHALRNPLAVMKKPLTVAEHQASRYVCEPLHLYDYCQTIGGACVVIVTTPERARNGPHKPIYIAGHQGMCAGRAEATGARPGLGIHQQDESYPVPRERDLLVYKMAGVERSDIDAFYTYDAMSSIVWMALERFGFCKPGEAWQFTKGGRIGPGGELPVNTHGGLLSEAHVSGWNHIIEMVRQLRGECGERQLPNAELLQWGTNRGDSLILRN